MTTIEVTFIRLELSEAIEERDRRRKLQYAMRMRDKEAEEQWQLEHKHGYCPKCFGLRALNGKCMNGCDD